MLDLAKASKRVSFPVVWAWATHFNLPKEDLCVCGYFEHQRRVHFEMMRGAAVPDHHGHSPLEKQGIGGNGRNFEKVEKRVEDDGFKLSITEGGSG